MHQSGIEIHDLAGVGEIARQFGMRTPQYAGALAEIAFLQGDILRTACLLEQGLPFLGNDPGRVVRHHHDVLRTLGQVGGSKFMDVK